MKKVLLDSSVVIDFLRRKDKRDSFLTSIPDYNFYISIVTHTELYSGKSIWEKKEARDELEKFLSIITILPLIEGISRKAGNIIAYNHDRSFMDCIIAATAINHKLTLATLNVKDFEKIKGLKLLR
jgi:predicted nucleic acid-binding protein